jgi:hypothetical protein
MPEPYPEEFVGALRRSKVPERHHLEGIWWGRLVGIPLSIAKGMVVNWPYNEVIAKLLDDFFLYRMWKNAYGCDVLGLLPDGAQRLPVDGDTNAQRVKVIPGLEEFTQEAVFKIVTRIRNGLSDSAEAALRIDFWRFIEDALSGAEEDQKNSLVHTRYFESDIVMEAVINHLKVHSSSGREPIVENEAAGQAVK